MERRESNSRKNLPKDPLETDPILKRWNAAIETIRAAGYIIREEWLEGGGGLCEFGGKKYFFSDQALSLFERLDQAEEAVKTLKMKGKIDE